MNRKARLMAFVGASCAAGAMMALPAQAAPKPPFNADVIGYFTMQYECDWVGQVGATDGRWTDATCKQTGLGQNRDLWELYVHRVSAGSGQSGHGLPGGPVRPGPVHPGLAA